MFLKILLTILVADIFAQVIKYVHHGKTTGKYDFHILASDGGMPSGHSTTVSALATAVYFETGLSVLFAITVIFGIIVMRDATGVRRAAGRQAHVLNQLVRKEHMKVAKLKELLGHTPKQVLAGVFLGIIIASVSYIWF